MNLRTINANGSIYASRGSTNDNWSLVRATAVRPRVVVAASICLLATTGAFAQVLVYPNYFFNVACDDATSMVEILGDQDGEFTNPETTEVPCGGEGTPDTELEEDEPTTSAPPGGVEDCGEDELTTPEPISLRWGSKVDSVADLVVQIPGRDYTLMRRFSSDTSIWTSDLRGHAGAGWALSPFQFMSYEVTGAGQTPSNRLVRAWYVHGSDSRMRFDADPDPLALNHFIGPPNSTIRGLSSDVTDIVTENFELYEDGKWRRIFAGDGLGPIPGILLREWDEFGNQAIYNWTMGYPWSRLGYISLWSPGRLEGDPVTADPLATEYAVLKFYWNDDNRISSIQVFRPNGTVVVDTVTVTKYVWTQEVRYTYKADGGLDYSDDLGSNSAVLVQVEYLTATDQTPDKYIEDTAPTDRLSEPGNETEELVSISVTADNVRRQVRQYRYANGFMVFNPEQLEYYTWKTGLDPSGLLEEDDSTTVISGEGVTVQDLAAKIVTYYTSGTYSGNVYQQLIQTDCGCGSASSQGKRLTYTYFDSDNSDLSTPSSPPTGFAADTDIVRTVGILEERWDEGTSAYVDHRQTWYDMIEIDTTYTTDVGGSSLDVPERFLRYKATVDLSNSDTWVVAYDYYGENDDLGNEAQKRKKYFPSAVEYQRSSGGDRPYVKFNDSGLVELYSYYTDASSSAHNARMRTVSVSDVATAGEPDEDPLNGDYGSLLVRYHYRTGDRDDLVSKIERFRTDSYDDPAVSLQAGDANNVETVEYTYTLGTVPGIWNGDYVQTRTIKVEKELESENGPSSTGTYDTIETYDSDGTITKIERPDGTITKFEYDSLHGSLVKQTETHTGQEGQSPTGPEPLDTTMAYDLLGRLTRVTYPNFAITNIWREMRVHPDDTDFNGATGDIDRFVEIAVPSATGAGVGDGHDFDGPIVLTYYNAGDRAIGMLEYPAETSEISRDSNGDLTSEPVDSMSPPATQLARSYSERDLAGLVQTERRYHDTANNGYYEDLFDYDELGRLSTSETDTGTIARYTYDIFDRLIEEEIGTDDGGSGNMRTVAEYIYDDGGVGDGNLTDVHRFTSDDDQDPNYQRTTEYVYDFRNRRIKTKNAVQPHELMEYDNLDRVVKRGLVSEAGFTGAALDDADSERGMYEEYDYSQRGLLYRRARAIDASVSPGSAEFIEWHSWYDEVGQIIAVWAPSAPATKMRYDELGRLSTVYSTDRGGDASPGQSGNYADVGVDADFLDDDIVFEQIEYRYVDEANETQGRGEGEVDLATTYLRAHDATSYPASGQTGDLASAASSIIVKTYTGYFYDDAGRQVRAVEYGTNDTSTDVFMTGSSIPNPDQSDPDDYADTPPLPLISKFVFGIRGLVETSVAPDETVTKYFYDDLNRQVGVIENYVNGDIERDSMATGGWELTDNDAGSGNQDEDRSTIFAFDGVDNLTHRIAAFYDGSAIDYQITEYIYGASTSGTTQDIGSTEMEIDTEDLLREVIYPDEFGGGIPKSVIYAFNLQGEVVATEDQNGTVHEYSRDDLGRITKDEATSFGSAIDQTIDEISITFDSMGRQLKVTSLGNSAIKNFVEFAYTDLWQIEKVAQDPLYNVSNTNEDEVEYDYKDISIDGDQNAVGNYSRLLTMKYPSNPGADRTTLAYSFGDDLQSGSPNKDDPNHRISRFSKLAWTAPILDHEAEYEWVGLSVLAMKTYTIMGLASREGVRLDRFHRPSTNGTTASGRYYGYDRFGRVKHQLWYDVETLETDDWDESNRPAIVELEYSYDNAHNVLTRYDIRGNRSIGLSTRDEEFAYDGLDRLQTAQRGLYDVSVPSFTAGGPLGQDWSLDALGNWVTTITDANGDGDFLDVGSGDISDTRSFTLANELIDRTITSYPSALDYSFDDAGNRTGREVNPDQAGANDLWTYVYDAWNRLVEVRVDALGDATDVETRALYTYNGLHQRVTRRANSDADFDIDGNDGGNLYYYDSTWRMVEERIDDAWDGSNTTFGSHEIIQRIWCPTYADALIATMTDVDDDNRSGDQGDPDGDMTDPDARIYYALQDRKHDVIRLLTGGGAILECVRYTPYGEFKTKLWHDISGPTSGAPDGIVNGYDTAHITANFNEQLGVTANYDPDDDINRDGIVNGADRTQILANWNATEPPAGSLSNEGNTVGYSGYIYDEAIGLSLVRFRWYDASVGRWVNRDPMATLGFPAISSSISPDSLGSSAEFFNAYQYSNDSPLVYLDPTGLAVTVTHPATPIGLALTGMTNLSSGAKIARLIAMGYPYAMIALALDTTVDVIRRQAEDLYFDELVKDATTDAMKKSISRAKRLLERLKWNRKGKDFCKGLDKEVGRWCKGPRRKCPDKIRSPRKCRSYGIRAAYSEACAAARIAVSVICKKGPDQIHGPLIKKALETAANCRARQAECLEKQRQFQSCPNN